MHKVLEVVYQSTKGNVLILSRFHVIHIQISVCFCYSALSGPRANDIMSQLSLTSPNFSNIQFVHLQVFNSLFLTYMKLYIYIMRRVEIIGNIHQ